MKQAASVVFVGCINVAGLALHGGDSSLRIAESRFSWQVRVVV